jgi:hypothetical protein
MAHKVYGAIVGAVRPGVLLEPFTKEDFRKACPGLGEGTYAAFLDKHRKGNPGGNSELFGRQSPGRLFATVSLGLLKRGQTEMR